MTTTETNTVTDIRDDPQEWLNADPLLTQWEAEWYASQWRRTNSRIEHRDAQNQDSGLTHIDLVNYPSQN